MKLSMPITKGPSRVRLDSKVSKTSTFWGDKTCWMTENLNIYVKVGCCKIVACSSHADCSSNHVCQSGTCHRLCLSDDKCDAGMVCLSAASAVSLLLTALMAPSAWIIIVRERWVSGRFSYVYTLVCVSYVYTLVCVSYVYTLVCVSYVYIR